MKKGVYNVMVTPFDADGNVDYGSYQSMIQNLLNNTPEIAGIVILGTTSESPTLREDEKRELVRRTADMINNRYKLVVGVGGNNTMVTLEFAQYCREYADYLMLTTPHYNKPTQEGMYQHFYTICQDNAIVNMPIMLYNIPSRCGVNLSPETIERLVNACPNIEGIKEASGSMDQVVRIRERCNIQIYAGDDALILPIMSLGGDGVISVASNVIPRQICDIVTYIQANQYDRARELYYRVVPLIRSLFCETNPVPVKHLLYHLGTIATDRVRLPLCQMESDRNREDLIYNYLLAMRENMDNNNNNTLQ
jgi:4-hydroxy-tetrahydrodipicolinate synthase